MTATVIPSGEGGQAGIETTAWDAELNVRRGNDEITLRGTWVCGA